MDADAHAYVDGADHTPWQIIMKYYISWYLNGAAPAVEVRYTLSSSRSTDKY